MRRDEKQEGERSLGELLLEEILEHKKQLTEEEAKLFEQSESKILNQ